MTIQTNTANISKTGIVVAYTDNSGAAVSQTIGFADKTLSVNSGFHVSAGDTSLAGALNVAGASNLNAALQVAGAAHLQNTVVVDQAATMNSTLAVNGAVQMNSGLNVTDQAFMHNGLQLDGAANIGDAMTVEAAVALHGALAVDDVSNLNSVMNVTGVVSMNDALNVANGVTLSSTLDVNGATHLQSSMLVDGVRPAGAVVTVPSQVPLDNAHVTYTIYNSIGMGYLTVPPEANGAKLLSLSFFGTGALNAGNSAKIYFNFPVPGNDGAWYGSGSNQLVTIDMTFGGTYAYTLTGGQQLGCYISTLAGYRYLNMVRNSNGSLAFQITYQQTGGSGSGGAVTLGSTLAVTGASVMNNNVTVNGTSALNGALTVSGASSLGGSLAVTGAASMNSTMLVSGASHLGSSLLADGAATLGSTLAVTGSANLGNVLNVTGAAHLSSTLLVDQAATLGSSLAVAGAVNAAGVLNAVGAAHLSNTVQVDGAATLGNSLAVAGAANLGSVLNVAGAAHLSNTVAVDGAATLGNTVAITGAANLGNVLNVAGAANLASTLAVTGPATMNNTLAVTGASNVNSTLAVTGASNLTNSMAVAGPAVFQNNMTVNGNMTVLGNQTSINTTMLQVKDNAVLIADNNTADALQSAIQIQYQPSGASAPLYAGMKRLPTAANNYGGEFVFFKDASSKVPETAVTVQSSGPAPMIHFPFENSLVDSMGVSTVTPVGSFTYGQGAVGSKALLFNNTTAGSLTNILACSLPHALTSFTVTGWFNLNSINPPNAPTGGAQIFFATMQGVPSIIIYCQEYNGVYTINSNISSSSIIGTVPIVPHVWYNFTLIFQSGGVSTLYLNNTVVGSIASTASMSIPSPIYLGGLNAQLSNYTIDGYLDDIKIYDSAIPFAPVVAGVSQPADIYAPVIADSFNCASDMNLKKNVVDLDGALDKLDALSGVYHDWIDEQQSAERQIGVIAQEVQAVYPELVAVGSNGYLSVNYPKLTAVLLQSIKELKAMVLEMVAEQVSA